MTTVPGLPPNRMSARTMHDTAWRGRTDLAQRIIARLTASPCTPGRLIHDCALPTSAVTVLLGKLSADRVVVRTSNNSTRYTLAQEARAA